MVEFTYNNGVYSVWWFMDHWSAIMPCSSLNKGYKAFTSAEMSITLPVVSNCLSSKIGWGPAWVSLAERGDASIHLLVIGCAENGRPVQSRYPSPPQWVGCGDQRHLPPCAASRLYRSYTVDLPLSASSASQIIELQMCAIDFLFSISSAVSSIKWRSHP
jgi:hypothetical protein